MAVDIKGLDFHYTHPLHTCFSGLDLTIRKGTRFGLFGPNGAGKTTLMGCMTGLLKYQKGSVSLLGQEIKTDHSAIKKMIGYVPQDFAFYHELSPTENLAYFAALSGLTKTQIKQKSAELLEILGLTEVKDKQVGKFSGGMKRKVNLAIGVIHDPPLLFLDEPTVGVDIQTRQNIIAYLKLLNQRGTTLVYTSHQLNEAQELCKDVAILHEGKILEHDTPENLISRYEQKDLEGLFVRLTEKSKTHV